ncbi:GIN domain-containing protein [Mucilaginibacter ginsenosidivorax]|uniref:Putative auto-transporter adhesin head GIN domain-containing protein n=1 Tax=Mucilaginibacter ginsenosidivorax TaxID=862126 RepID=A0A5B8W113_9SPHI|nr:DUF2807 domain-containing protein [Mucilaginibacter ginsenosidivorax]QEC77660.1 hypothetical protein FSB76_17565 [Mucilaginibacter ginsenosidivorax]
MKTKILSVITMFVVVLGLTQSTYAKSLTIDAFTVLNDISTINKIEVHGNVELYISDATRDQVKVYNKYYAERALVQTKNGVLSIASYTNEKLVVWVSAADLRSVSVFDNSSLTSFGKLSKIEFNVDLHNSAVASLNLDAFSTTLTVKDNATADLKGATEELNLNRAIQSNVNNSNFAVTHLVENKAILAAGMGRSVIGI